MVDTYSTDMVDTFLLEEVRHALERCHRKLRMTPCLPGRGDVEIRSVGDVQEALGHQDAATTRIYLERVGVKRERLRRWLRK